MARFKIYQYVEGHEHFVSVKHRGRIIDRVDTSQDPLYAHGIEFTGNRSMLAVGYFLPLTVGRVSSFDQILLTTNGPPVFLNRFDYLTEAEGIVFVNGECYLSLPWPKITEFMAYSVNGYNREDSFKPQRPMEI